jgi:purine-binding chemotaxis protein CheW
MPPSNISPATEALFSKAEESQLSFILFTLGEEIYGVPMTTTREVVRVKDIKPTPYMVSYFRGVINLRGQIVSVLDLRLKFEIAPAQESQGLILIVETADGGLLGAIVDDLVSVEKVQAQDIFQPTSLQTKVPIHFFYGVATVKDRLVNMVDIAGCLSAEDLRTVKNTEAA